MTTGTPPAPENAVRPGGASAATARRARLSGWVVLALLLVAGLLGYADYGISWDEGTSRAEPGLLSWKFAFEGDPALLTTRDRLYGPAYELFLLAIEKAAGVKDTRDIFVLRHLATFLTFWAGCVAFLPVARRVLGDGWGPVLALVLLVLQPRVFADAHYNSKDLAFLALFVLATLTQLRFLERPGFVRALLHGAVCGFLIDTRIGGVIAPVMTAALFAAQSVASRGWGALASRACLSPLALLTGATIGAVVLFWPLLWHDPTLFVDAFRRMSHYSQGGILYRGDLISTAELPWHYLPTWVLLTSPLVLLVPCAAGAAAASVRFLRNPFQGLRDRPAETSALAWLLGPPTVALVLGSSLYNGWRHMYFLAPAMALFAAAGIVAAWDAAGRFAGASKLLRAGIAALVALGGGSVALDMVRIHPHGFVWFGVLAGKDTAHLKAQYELDYWGLSYLDGLRFIAANDPSDAIPVYSTDPPGRGNLMMLDPAVRKRFVVVMDPAQAAWAMTGRRDLPPALARALGAGEDRSALSPAALAREAHRVALDGAPYLQVFRLRP